MRYDSNVFQRPPNNPSFSTNCVALDEGFFRMIFAGNRDVTLEAASGICAGFSVVSKNEIMIFRYFENIEAAKIRFGIAVVFYVQIVFVEFDFFL
jgi:hypothetical protein